MAGDMDGAYLANYAGEHRRSVLAATAADLAVAAFDLGTGKRAPVR